MSRIESIATQFLPADRESLDVVKRQGKYFDEIPLFRTVIDAISDMIMVLNQCRQIVVANKSILEHPNLKIEHIYGLRPGESMRCIHSDESEGGCGTTIFCRTCGAAKAIRSSIRGTADIQECRINRKEKPEALDLRIKATPITVHDEQFTFFVITDISHEKRRRALERIFFHDILNVVGNIKGFVDLLKMGFEDKKEQYLEILSINCDNLIEEINAQRDLAAAESNDLSVHPEFIDAVELAQELVDVYKGMAGYQNRNIKIDDNAEPVQFISDKTILSRVIGNMIKNAVESSKSGDTVTIGIDAPDDAVEFWVHNPVVIPQEVQYQIFQRSFSTKSKDRGLGTYSMKLLTERYLHGTVSFSSTLAGGTVFRARYPLSLDEDAGILGKV